MFVLAKPFNLWTIALWVWWTIKIKSNFSLKFCKAYFISLIPATSARALLLHYSVNKKGNVTAQWSAVINGQKLNAFANPFILSLAIDHEALLTLLETLARIIERHLSELFFSLGKEPEGSSWWLLFYLNVILYKIFCFSYLIYMLLC